MEVTAETLAPQSVADTAAAVETRPHAPLQKIPRHLQGWEATLGLVHKGANPEKQGLQGQGNQSVLCRRRANQPIYEIALQVLGI